MINQIELRASFLIAACSLTLSWGHAEAQNPTSSERELHQLIMAYRAEHGLPSIPLSAKLTHVAQLHVEDLERNQQSWPQECNLHSWSGDGSWSSCCYTSDHAQAQCMWSKPSEIARYRGDGFEIAHGYSAGWHSNTPHVSPQSSLEGWQSSHPHNAVILNEGMWHDNTWRAIGIGMSEHFAVVWFGTVRD